MLTLMLVLLIDYWEELGLISKHYKNCAITFSIDGLKDTNHIQSFY